MIAEGESAPDFSLKNQDGKTVSLKELQGKTVVLYFYPKDSTPGCTLEGNEFSELAEEFKKLNAVVFGVSKDTVESHKTFCASQGFQIDLLSDEGGAALEKYGAWREKVNFGKKYMGIVRSTVVIDEEGVVRKHWKNVRAGGHAQKVLAYLSKVSDK